ncbi:anthranilate synthase component I family protein [uncultured Croceitalea sp.]|uniref:anthranilate synthase component I family protein n=1 Tax=uncultured Croceitalea sp. TaxID=1798908 RepID=UPI0033060FFB
MRTLRSFRVDNIDRFKESLLQWAQQFTEVVYLDSNHHQDTYTSFEALLAVDALTELSTSSSYSAFDEFTAYKKRTNDWVFGYLAYDLKNELHQLRSDNHDGLDFPLLHFFQPKRMIRILGNEVQFSYISESESEMKNDFEAICNTQILDNGPIAEKPKIKLRIHKDAYLDKINQVLDQIHRGNIYEVNICQEFYAENHEIEPLATFLNLNEISTPPFASFLKLRDKYLLSASPERYIKRQGATVTSQPIKGTAPRAIVPEEDELHKRRLKIDAKERSENIMIVDLVRNDLSHHALKGSVTVDELCEVYTFKQVHQMISTISARVPSGIDALELIKATFPMGSMTGAPKISAMKIIEQIEETKRGLYSGAVGYFTPDDDFDFNVVIRSILYNANQQYISFTVGSAITAKSIPLKEYEECLLKAKAMRNALESH